MSSGDLVGPANAGLRRDSQIVGSTSIRRKYHRAPASSLADPEAIADADLVIGEALHREVLAEISRHEIRPPKILRPVAVGFELVDHDRTLLAAMALEVSLAVAIEIQPAGDNPPHHRRLPDRRPDSPALPRDVLRKSDIDRNDDTHRGTSADVFGPSQQQAKSITPASNVRLLPSNTQ